MIIRELLKLNLEKFLISKKYDLKNFTIEIPKDRAIADYATNISFILAKVLKKNPIQIAEDLSKELEIFLNLEFTNSVKVFALRGFINIQLSKEFVLNHLLSDDFAINLVDSKNNILLEYVSANPTGPLHIGHGRWAAVGDSISRILSRVGYSVAKEFYINDAGNQINNLLLSIDAHKNNQKLPEDGYAGNYVKELVNEKNPIKYLINHQKNVLKTFGVEFDQWFSEKEGLHHKGEVEKGIAMLKEKGFTYEQGGALFFRSTDFKDDKDRVLIKENGDYTYFAADVAYHFLKVNRGFQKLINIWGADHHGYIARIKAALKALVNDKAELEVLLGQLVTLYRDGIEVKMSKRTGEMITLDEVIEEIGVDATRFFLVLKSIDTALDFDLELAKKKSNDNPVYYVQYAHARINSILKKSTYKAKYHLDLDFNDTEMKLLKYLLSFEDELYNAAEKREPHKIANYLIECANIFHNFYHNCKVNVEDKKVAENRLAIIESTKDIIALGLSLLGVSAPISM